MYDSATPNPTGSLSGPWIDDDAGSPSMRNVTGKFLYSYLTFVFGQVFFVVTLIQAQP